MPYHLQQCAAAAAIIIAVLMDLDEEEEDSEEEEEMEASSYESEEDLIPPATPPLLKGHIARHQESLVNGGHNLTLTRIRKELEQARALVADLSNQHDKLVEQVNVEAREQNRVLLPHLATSASTVSTPYVVSSFSSLPVKQEYSPVKEEKIDIIEEMDNSLEVNVEAREQNRRLLPHLAASASTVSALYTNSSFSYLPVKQEDSPLKEEKIDIFEEMDNSLQVDADASASTVSTSYAVSSFSALPVKQENSPLKEEKFEKFEEMDKHLEMKISSTSHNSYFLDCVVKEELIDPEHYQM